MAKRRASYRRVKVHFTYTVKEAARRLDTHPNTVRRWIADGLPIVADHRRPQLIRGRDLFDFLKRRVEAARAPCPPGHFYCVKCRAPRRPAEGMADYIPLTDIGGNLMGLCPDCSTWIYRRVSLVGLAKVRGDLDVSVPKAQRHLAESRSPSRDVA